MSIQSVEFILGVHDKSVTMPFCSRWPIKSRDNETEDKGGGHAHANRDVVGRSSPGLTRRSRRRRTSRASRGTSRRGGRDGIRRTSRLDLKLGRGVDLHEKHPLSTLGSKTKSKKVDGEEGRTSVRFRLFASEMVQVDETAKVDCCWLAVKEQS